MFKVLLLPLRQTNDEREVFADSGARLLDNFNCKGRALFQHAAIFIVANIRAFPEESINQITMRTMKLRAVKTGFARNQRASGEGIGNIGNILLGHRLADFFTGIFQSRRRQCAGFGIEAGAVAAH